MWSIQGGPSKSQRCTSAFLYLGTQILVSLTLPLYRVAWELLESSASKLSSPRHSEGLATQRQELFVRPSLSRAFPQEALAPLHVALPVIPGIHG